MSLTLLRIRDLAIIEHSELELGPGLNVITGETGAGKSILIAALTLVLGGRGNAALVRTGASRAEVEALFELGPAPALRRLLAHEGIEADDELVVRRVLLRTGRTRAYVGGRLTSARTLRRLARGLVDISSQHEHHTLVASRIHLDHLDGFASLTPARAAVATAHTALLEAISALREAEASVRARGEREDLLRFQLGELDDLSPSPGELDTLEAAARKMRHAADLAQVAGDAEHALYAADNALATRLARLTTQLEQGARHDLELGEMSARLDGARMEVEEVGRDLGRYLSGLTVDPRALAQTEERLLGLRRLVRKHGHTLDELLTWAEQARAELADLGCGEARLAALTEAVHDARTAARRMALSLSDKRRRAAGELASAMTHELSTLGMGGAKVLVDVAPLEGTTGVALGDLRLTARGLDRVEFMIAPNPGEEPRPLAQVASGGELSRALLALKRVLAGIGPVGMFVFDEVDTGVGGAIAEVIGQKLADIATHNQVLCITHSPQVAVYADQHLHVHKVQVSGRTLSRVKELDEAGHLNEISRMLGGIDVSEASKAAASELRLAARTARSQARAVA